jgi:PAS domain S-box-containing protein
MQDQTKRIGVITGFVVMFAVLVANAIVVRRQLRLQFENHSWVTHTLRVQLAISTFESLLKDAETGQRGYLYTQDPAYLKPYKDAKAGIAADLDALQRLTADNVSQQRRIADVRKLSDQKMDELQRTILLTRSGDSEAAHSIVQSGAGLRLMDSIRTITSQMRAEEDRLATARLAAYDTSLRNTRLSIALTSALAGAGLLLLLTSMLAHLRSRERHSRQLLDREEWFRITLTSLGDAVITTDGEGKVTYLNPLAEDIMGVVLADVLGHRIEDVFPIFNEATLKKVENPIVKVLEFGRVVGLANHTVLRRGDGSMIPIEDSAAPILDRNDSIIGVVLVFRDATNERKTQKLLRETEKLTSAARMSATVAHEINNPLEAVTNLLYLAKGSEDVPEPVVTLLEAAERELQRVSLITKRTLGFYRESKIPERVNLPNLIDQVSNVYSNRAQVKKVAITKDFRPCPDIMGIEGELRQAVSNLISNAIDAVPERGRIHLSCGPDAAGQQVVLVLQDDGPGVAPHVAERIFEPFFTTKKDVGTGLGLWITKEIVERHNGAIMLHKIPGELGGAAFSIALPCSE